MFPKGAIVFLAIFGVLAMGCGGTRTVTDEPATPAVNPEQELQERFSMAYFALSCFANEGIDPLMTMNPLRSPLDYIDALIETESPKLEGAERILSRNGFASADLFKMVSLKLKSNRPFWKTIDDRFVDELLKCK